MPDRVAKRQATCQTWEEWRAASTTGRAPDRTRIPLRGEGLSDEWMQVAVVAGWLVTWWRHCPNQTRTSIRMHPCPTTRGSYFPTHRSPCRPRRSNRHLTIPAVTPAVCQSPPDSNPAPSIGGFSGRPLSDGHRGGREDAPTAAQGQPGEGAT